jgi:hypothetical protein
VFPSRTPRRTSFDMLIVHDREQPCAQIGAVLPEMLFGDGAGQAALDEIVGPNDVPRQRACIASQPRNFCFDHPIEIVHPGNLILHSLPGIWGSRRSQDGEAM